MEEKALAIVIDDTNVEEPIFIDIENEHGESIKIGRNIRRDDGYGAIVITSKDLEEYFKS